MVTMRPMECMQMFRQRGIYNLRNFLIEPQRPGVLFSASGDSNVYSWDLQTGKQLGVFSGHSDFIHCVTQVIKPKSLSNLQPIVPEWNTCEWKRGWEH
jgi:WD40 repeat protein